MYYGFLGSECCGPALYGPWNTVEEAIKSIGRGDSPIILKAEDLTNVFFMVDGRAISVDELLSFGEIKFNE